MIVFMICMIMWWATQFERALIVHDFIVLGCFHSFMFRCFCCCCYWFLFCIFVSINLQFGKIWFEVLISYIWDNLRFEVLIVYILDNVWFEVLIVYILKY